MSTESTVIGLCSVTCCQINSDELLPCNSLHSS